MSTTAGEASITCDRNGSSSAFWRFAGGSCDPPRSRLGAVPGGAVALGSPGSPPPAGAALSGSGDSDRVDDSYPTDSGDFP
eukprot:CAMPEP_0204349614 /NCGR_PEP_ID=MMETSP0469-20131031/29671_1 /ASSEMBLY_ACC=CAM_ASM_000384 /TAXON_ID=2969 /ORGANISM="Oxyrrhis marina" /LENGTH=80 /DNA_ID=CAMNT_0051335837 /DNA_START=109 /DNA_END=347 /DNA_ORIENTATION=+